MPKIPFTVQVRHDGGASVSLRFQVHDGIKASIDVGRQKGSKPTLSGQIDDIEPSALPAGRFLRQDAEGRRRSYSLGRLDSRIVLGTALMEWHDLLEIVDEGFRYLVLPEDSMKTMTASIQLPVNEPVAGSAPIASGTSPLRARLMASGRSSSPAPAKRSEPSRRPPAMAARPPAGTSAPSPTSKASGVASVAPAIAEQALKTMTRDVAIGHLKEAWAQVRSMEERLGRAEDSLERSRAREADLVALLAHWQERDGTPG